MKENKSSLAALKPTVVKGKLFEVNNLHHSASDTYHTNIF
jgi:hypothetical protein